VYQFVNLIVLRAFAVVNDFSELFNNLVIINSFMIIFYAYCPSLSRFSSPKRSFPL